MQHSTKCLRCMLKLRVIGWLGPRHRRPAMSHLPADRLAEMSEIQFRHSAPVSSPVSSPVSLAFRRRVNCSSSVVVIFNRWFSTIASSRKRWLCHFSNNRCSLSPFPLLSTRRRRSWNTSRLECVSRAWSPRPRWLSCIDCSRLRPWNGSR